MLEFDLEAAIQRHPQIIVVDELAHTNVSAPGQVAHANAARDIEDLLDAGIDVYTTLNVQHLESLKDIVARITGVHVRETVPDSIFESADDVELIDLPPDDLLERLKEGKVPPVAGAAGDRAFLPQGEPDSPARARASPHGRPRQPADAGLARRVRHRGNLAHRRAADRVRRPQSLFRKPDPGRGASPAVWMRPGWPCTWKR